MNSSKRHVLYVPPNCSQAAIFAISNLQIKKKSLEIFSYGFWFLRSYQNTAVVLVSQFLIYMHYFFSVKKAADCGRNAVPRTQLSKAQSRKVLWILLNITQTMQLIPTLPHLCYSSPSCLLNRGFTLHYILQSDYVPSTQIWDETSGICFRCYLVFSLQGCPHLLC